jgi:hypothetical protein
MTFTPPMPRPNANELNAPRITMGMVQESKPFACEECGNLTFEEIVTFKRLSSLLSPTGKEELIPVGLMACKKCGKVPTQLDKEGLAPKELLAKKSISL